MSSFLVIPYYSIWHFHGAKKIQSFGNELFSFNVIEHAADLVTPGKLASLQKSDVSQKIGTEVIVRKIFISVWVGFFFKGLRKFMHGICEWTNAVLDKYLSSSIDQ